jgi:hypothetical protein
MDIGRISSTPPPAAPPSTAAATAGAEKARDPGDTFTSSEEAPEGIRRSLALTGERLWDLTKAAVEVLRSGGGLRACIGEKIAILSALQLSGLGFLVPSFMKGEDEPASSGAARIAPGKQLHSEGAASAQSSTALDPAVFDPADMVRPYEPLSPAKAQSVTQSKWQGQPLWYGAGVFEDNHLMAYEVKKKDGSTTLVLRGTLREPLSDTMEERLRDLGAIEGVGKPRGTYCEVRNGALCEATGKIPIKGRSWALDLGGGISLVYRPHEHPGARGFGREKVPVAVQGELTIEISQYNRAPGDVESALSTLGKVIGREILPATRGEMQLLYLDKMIRAKKAETGGYERGLKALERKGAPIEERIAFAAGHLEKIGVPIDGALWKPLRDDDSEAGGTAGPASWEPRQDKDSRAGGLAAGAPWWGRADSDFYLEGRLKDVVLTHNMYQKDEAEGILALFRNTGSLLCTRERNHRLGISGRGLASQRDMDVGAGNYSFLHIGKSSESGALVFSKDLLGRTDTIVHRFGMFGRTGRGDLAKRLTLDDITRYPVYEIMVRNNVSLENYVERINVSSEEVRAKVIDGLKALGYGRLRGVEVEKIVRVRPSFFKQLAAALRPWPRSTKTVEAKSTEPSRTKQGPAPSDTKQGPVLGASEPAGAKRLPESREPIRMEPPKAITAVDGTKEAAQVHTRARFNPSMLAAPGKVLVTLDGGDGKLTIPRACGIARDVLHNFKVGVLSSESVTEIRIVEDLRDVDQIAASPSGRVIRREGTNVVIDTDEAGRGFVEGSPDSGGTFRRIYVTRDAIEKGILDTTPFRQSGGEPAKVAVLQPRTIGPLLRKDASMFCGGLVSISAEPPEGFFVSSTAMEMQERGRTLRPAADADAWLYRVPDTRKDSYFKFLYANPDRPSDTSREGKFLIATGVGPANDPTSPGGAEASLLWMGDEQHGVLDAYLKTLQQPGLRLEDLYRHEGFIQRIKEREVLLGSADKVHTLTKEGFAALKTDPVLYRRVYSEEYDKFLRTLFEKPDGPPAKASYLLATSRGCSQQCTICCSGGCSTPQFFSGERMMKEIEKIAGEAKPKDAEVIEVFFLDSNLNNDPQRIIDFADLYEKSPLKGKFRFYCRHSSPNGFLKTGDDDVKHPNKALISAYARLGMREVFMGIDTYDDNSTLTMKSNRFQVASKEGDARPTYRAGEIRELIKALDDGGLVSKGFFITNNPWVTDLDRIDSYYNIIQLWLESPHFSIDSRTREVLQLKPFEGSPITDVAREMKLDVLKVGRFVAKGVLGEMDEMMSFSGLGTPRVSGDAGATITEFREGIARLRKSAEEVMGDPSRTTEDRRKAELIIEKIMARDKDISAQMAQEKAQGTPGAGEFLAEAERFAQMHRSLPPFDPAEQKAYFLGAARDLFDGLRKTLPPIKMEPPSKKQQVREALEERGYRAQIAHLSPSEPHTLENLQRYLIDNLGEETMREIKSGSGRFVIAQGEGRSVLSSLRMKGWQIGEAVKKAQGFHQIFPAVTDKGEKVQLVARVNGEDRVVHIQSLVKLAGLTEDRIVTTGAFTSLRDEYLKTFTSLGKPPDFVVYGLAGTAATAVLSAHPIRNAPELLEMAGRKKRTGGPESTGEGTPHDLEGLSMHVIELKDGRTMWFIPPLYGDLSKDMMEALVDGGARDIIFAGTTGSLTSQLKVGAVVSPVERIRPDGTKEKLDWLASSHGEPCTYMRVPTPNVETEAWLSGSLDKGVDTIEVELGYWLDGMKKRPDIRFHVQNVVSDVLGGEAKSDMTRWTRWDNFKAQGDLREGLQAAFGLTEDDLRISRYRSVPLLR